MIPVDQTILATKPNGDNDDDVPGDCYRACIASWLELPIDEVPHFILKETWWDDVVAFVRERLPGKTIQNYAPPLFPAYRGDNDDMYAIAVGPSPRGDFMHAVLVHAATGELAHDPHPSRAGLAGPIVEMELIVNE